MTEEYRRAMDAMSRFCDVDDSTITCRCGQSFTWSGPDEALDAFVAAHADHMAAAVASAGHVAGRSMSERASHFVTVPDGCEVVPAARRGPVDGWKSGGFAAALAQREADRVNAAVHIADRIMADATDRSGIMDGIEPDMLAEIRAAWIAIVADELGRR